MGWDGSQGGTPGKIASALFNPNDSTFGPFAILGGPSQHIAGPGASLTGPPPDPRRLVAQPDGSSMDPVTGQVYRPDQNGQFQAVANPNSAQQVGANMERATGLYGQVPGYDAREAAAFGREGGLADTLNQMVLGNGPSLAAQQLAAGLDQGQRQQLAQAAGASGSNAALARLGAMQGTGDLAARTNQQQALARTGEEMGALGELGHVTGAMVDQSQNIGGQKLNAANAINQLAVQGQGNLETNTINAAKDNAEAEANRRKSVFGGAGGFVSALGAL